MRAFVITTFALAVAFAPATALAQTTTSGTATTQEKQEQPAAKPPTIAFDTPTGVLLVSIKPDKTAVFEEMLTKLKAGFGKVQDEALKKQAAGLKFYKANEKFGPNALYVVFIDPAAAATEYDLFQMMAKTMTPDELRAPETAEMWKKYADAFPPGGMSKLSLTLFGG